MSKIFDTFEIRHLLLCSISPVGGIVAYILLWNFPTQSIYLKLLTVLLLCVASVYFSYHFFQKLNNKVNVISNLLEAVEQEDFSLRGSTKGYGVFEGVIKQINAIAGQLSRHRQQQREMDFLLQKVISNITISIFALDSNNHLIWCNDAATQMLGCPLDSLIGEDGARWQLNMLMENANSGHPIEFKHNGRPGRFKVNSDTFISNGKQNVLLFIYDVEQLLRHEEKKAWQNLLRVISHEINNSLSPIASISQMLQQHYRNHSESVPAGFVEGVDLINRRAKELISFISSYQQLNKLAPPRKEPVDITRLIQELPLLFLHRKFILNGPQHVVANIDRGQIHQLLINLVKNADEAMAECRESITISWRLDNAYLIISIVDCGVGLSNPDNLFVPFYTTKSSGSGIGLILCRQIVEYHGGYLLLNNREDQQGCNVTISLQV